MAPSKKQQRQDEIDTAVEKLAETIDEVACDSDQWSQAESVEIYERLTGHCGDWVRTIRAEMPR